MENLLQSKYPECIDVQRQELDDFSNLKLDEAELEKLMATKNKVLPIYELALFEYKFIKSSSFVNNELLRCRWANFLNHLDGRIRSPFVFPNVHDLHFCRNLVRYEPKESIKNRPSYRFHLSSGPGVDRLGQKPIPDNMHLRKTS